MKTLAELEAIRQKTLDSVNLAVNTRERAWSSAWRPAALPPAHAPVMLAFVEEVKKRNLSNVTVAQTGCIGMCRLEPMVEITLPGQEKVTYVKVNPSMVPRIVTEHIVNGKPVAEYTIGAQDQ